VTDEPDLFGVTETPSEVPPGRLLSPYLKHGAHGAKEAGLRATNPGQAAIADPSLGETCRRCLYWGEPGSNPRDHWGVLKPAACKKFIAKMHVRPARAPKLSPSACACTEFELNRWPPELERRGGK
jgi:hypothetical protein